MRFERLSIENLSKEQFDQMVDIEANCGLEPYSPEGLMECIVELDTFACFDGDKVVGFVTIQSNSYYLGGSLYIVNINVARAYRGCGIAKRMLYTVFEYYTYDHADKMITLDVEKTNKAMELYRKIGFQVVDMPSRNGDTDLVMAMPLRILGENLRCYSEN